MRKLLHGIHHFQSHVFGRHRELFERLADGQILTLFITCPNSRFLRGAPILG
jgi:carbonic anhydrase